MRATLSSVNFVCQLLIFKLDHAHFRTSNRHVLGASWALRKQKWALMGASWRVTRDSIGQQWSLLVTSKPLQSLMIGKISAERVTGIEPAWPAWKAGALPLSYTRVSRLRLGQV
jgi:hypothetical protein